MLDLEEALEELGYAKTPSREDLKGWWVVARPPGKAKEGSFVPGPKRAYRRHPPGTPTWRKGDQDRRRERRRAYLKRKRAKMREEAAAAEAAIVEGFMNALIAYGLLEQATWICVGRGVTDDQNRGRPDRLLLHEPDSLAARIDLWTYLVHPDRGWTVARVASLFGTTRSRVAKWLWTRSKAAGVREALDAR